MCWCYHVTMESKYTREMLEPLVATSVSLAEVIRKLGLRPVGGVHRHISSRIRYLGIPTAHFTSQNRFRRADVLPEELLAPLVVASVSYWQVIKKLGVNPTSGKPFSYNIVRARIRELNLPLTHFKFQGWSKGLTKDTDIRVAKSAKAQALPDIEVFCENSKAKGQTVRRRLLELGRAYRCAECHTTEWLGKPLTLHLDHINGVRNDNRQVNLRFVCPNCHQQTETWGNKGFVGER